MSLLGWKGLNKAISCPPLSQAGEKHYYERILYAKELVSQTAL